MTPGIISKVKGQNVFYHECFKWKKGLESPKIIFKKKNKVICSLCGKDVEIKQIPTIGEAIEYRRC